MADELGAWKDSAEYRLALEAWLAPIRETVFYSGMVWAHTDIGHFRAFIDLVQPYTPLAGKQILDSGCGSAGLMLALRRAGAGNVVGIELDPNIARLATLRTANMPGMRVIRDDAALLGLEAESFDVIMSIHVIEHVMDHLGYLQTQARLLRRGGVMLLACPNRLWPIEVHSQLPLMSYVPRRMGKTIGRAMERSRRLPPTWRDRGRNATLYEHNFTILDLRRLLGKYGFQILLVNPAQLLAGDWANSPLRPLAGAASRAPGPIARWVAAAASKNINIVCRKPA